MNQRDEEDLLELLSAFRMIGGATELRKVLRAMGTPEEIAARRAFIERLQQEREFRGWFWGGLVRWAGHFRTALLGATGSIAAWLVFQDQIKAAVVWLAERLSK